MNNLNADINSLILPTTININSDKCNEILSALKETDIPCSTTSDSNNISITFGINDIEKLNKLLQPFGISKQIDEMPFTVPKVESKEKLIPFVNAISNLYDRKLNFTTNKIKSHTNHINLLKSSLEQKNKQLKKFQARNNMLKGLSNSFGILSNPINALIKRNELKIDRLQRNKIPKLNKQIEIHNNTLDKLNKRVERHTIRKSLCSNLSDVIKSFAIINSTERSEKYFSAMTGLNSDLISLNNEKIETYTSKVNNIKNSWNNLSSNQQIQAQEQFNKINKQIQALKTKNQVLGAANNDFNKNTKIDKAEKAFDTAASSDTSLINTVDNISILTATTLSDKAAHIKIEQLDKIMDKDGDHIPDRIDSEFNPEVTRYYEEQDRKSFTKENNTNDENLEISSIDVLNKNEVVTNESTKKSIGTPQDNFIIKIVTQKQYDALINSDINFKVNSKQRKENSIPIMINRTDEQAVKQIIKNTNISKATVKK